MNRQWRVVAVDDEPPALRRIQSLLQRHATFDLVATFDDPVVALEGIRELDADLLLLDVQMPGMSGLDLAARLGGVAPLVIFVTAFDEHAVRAFEVHAFDYLLKPLDPIRLEEALVRAAERLRRDDAADLHNRLERLIDTVANRDARGAPDACARVPVRTEGTTMLIEPRLIDRVEVAGSELRVHVGGRALVTRETLSAFQARLPGHLFLRVHRSVLVNVACIREVQPWFRGDYVLLLDDGARIVTGRTYRAAVRRLLGVHE